MSAATPGGQVDVYPVGLLHDIRHRRVRQGIGYLRRQLLSGEFRAVRSYFGGYLAEPGPLPRGLRRCGSGWTRERALRSLRRHMRRAGIEEP